jgi:hypothetical protein
MVARNEGNARRPVSETAPTDKREHERAQRRWSNYRIAKARAKERE